MNILDTIVAQKKREVALLPPIRVTAADLQQALAVLPARRDFLPLCNQPGAVRWP